MLANFLILLDVGNFEHIILCRFACLPFHERVLKLHSGSPTSWSLKASKSPAQ